MAELVREGGNDRELRRSAEHAENFRVARGRYLPNRVWTELDDDARYKAQIHAWVETTRVRQVFSHWSAAALWGYPIIGAWPRRIHVTLPLSSGQRNTRGVVRHLAPLRDDEMVQRDGLTVTSPTRTIADLLRCAPFETGVAACDRAFAVPKTAVSNELCVDVDALMELSQRLTGQRGVRRLRSVIEFADGRSGSPGESLSRVQISRLRLPAPDLQFEVTDRQGKVWHSDFGWPEFGLLGEFDGKSKYTRDRYLKGRDVADIVIDEKMREDAMRLVTGFRMARWTWAMAVHPERLGRVLASAGLTPPEIAKRTSDPAEA